MAYGICPCITQICSVVKGLRARRFFPCTQSSQNCSICDSWLELKATVLRDTCCPAAPLTLSLTLLYRYVSFLNILHWSKLRVSLLSPHHEVTVGELRSSCARAGPGPWVELNDQHHAPSSLTTGKNSTTH